MLKHTQTYEIMVPEDVGVKQTSLVMGKHSGRHAFVHKLDELGYHLAANQLEDAFVRFKALADRKKHVYDEDIEALVDEEIATAQDHIKLVSLSVIAGTRGPQRATMKLDIDGKTLFEERDGNGPVDAVFNCVKAMVPHDAVLELYQVHAVTEGTDAQAEVSVRLSENGRAVTAKGADPDTLVASAKAYLAALNKLMARRLRGHAEERRLHSTKLCRSVCRDQRAAEVIVYADTEDVVGEVCAARERRIGGAGPGERVVERSQIHIEILSLGGPLARNRPFDTGADRPTRSGVVGAGGCRRRRERRAARKCRRGGHGRAALNLTIRQTTRDIE
jgi:hypothetical protein